MKKYILILHDLEDLSCFGTEDETLFNKAVNSDDLMEFIYDDSNHRELEELGDDLTGVEVLGMTYGLQY